MFCIANTIFSYYLCTVKRYNYGKKKQRWATTYR